LIFEHPLRLSFLAHPLRLSLIEHALRPTQ
jgi:hypothetical protein